ncbi:dTDP-4-dehydrorhamnose reductase [Haloglomus salinum]|uniref:dTDP-4-dehydrorhamnose reductase n=1 Tax=Haloglomus salinum TaxID=2962673 RepID=UPI0020C97A9C|nr:dTDP-4-dehydrorhamnose reductase [Haloglomus salinum]
MRLLVTGATGLLGSTLVARAMAAGHETVATYHRTDPGIGDDRTEMDITDSGRVAAVVGASEPDAVVNCAAMTDVDGCEKDPERAAAVNADAPGELAAASADAGAALVQVSTDYVFDGRAERRYTEADDPAPLQVYGRTKLEGERAARKTAPDALVPRLSFVYGRHGATDELTGFPAWVMDRLETGEAVPLFVDQRVTPTRAGAAAEAILSLLEREAAGVVNVAARSCVTPYDFGHRIADRRGVPEDRLVESESTALDRPARRPSNTCLDVTRVEDRLGREQPTLEADLDAVL